MRWLCLAAALILSTVPSVAAPAKLNALCQKRCAKMCAVKNPSMMKTQMNCRDSCVSKCIYAHEDGTAKKMPAGRGAGKKAR